jgi:hypothetical protein
MYENHNHAYDENHLVHHDQNKEIETKENEDGNLIFKRKTILLDVSPLDD